MTIAVVAACTALTLARPADEKVHPGPDHNIDLVELLRKIDAREAAFFAVLRDAGLDDETMMMILERLGPDERVRRALAEADLHELHGHLEREVRAGRMSKKHAIKKFHGILREVEGADVKQRLTEQVKAGLITEAEAKKALHHAHDELKARLMHRHERHVPPEAIERLHALHEAVKADLEAGLITEAEARDRMRAAKLELHEQLRVKRRTARED